MSGKSTLLKLVAVIQILAQVSAAVTQTLAKFGVVIARCNVSFPDPIPTGRDITLIF